MGSSCIPDYIAVDRTTVYSAKYLRKLIGRSDIEDALKRLDNLTQEEARMVTTQVLKATRIIDDRVRGVDDRVTGVNGMVNAIDGKVAKIIDGMQPSLVSCRKMTDPDAPRWK